ncbi:MAG: hypothetical protein AVDCRST_MAG26-1829 [uncultured Chloroflexia bacterium]|uniref:CHAT domain-containing protein n=1 Tax=uncultured Chloroflexia bacterium TaxID=1672391 RepID=A0A6J4ID74_9CHLR|nr:MAG: hypothetical protein AVDCRST_MAG26-1829 [uncultured Chloroflexia bacterium]
MAFQSSSNVLTLQLTARDGTLQVRATADRGEARAETAAPTAELLTPLTRYEPGDFPEAVVAPLGDALTRRLLAGDVRKLAADLLGDARAAKVPVRIELRFDPDQVELAQFPWEMIRSEQGEYLVRDGLVDLTRYISYPQPPPVFDATINEQPLLRVVAAPSTLGVLEFGDLGLQHVETLPHASFAALTNKLLVERTVLWGLQFDGHGGVLPQCGHCDVLSLPTSRFCRMCGKPLGEAEQVGALAFERQGMVDWVAAGEFGSLLYNAHIRLAVLLACESARIGGRTVWSGLAPKLLLAGVPAVLGMQYPVYDDYANLFARTFYASLLRTGDVVAAMRAARRADVREAWYSPVLYLRRRAAPSVAEPALPAFQQRAVDTAAPEAAEAGSTFLVRLWIRRPGTPQRSEAQLRAELDVPEGIAVRTKEDVAEVKFAPVPGRALRRGEVDVRLDAIGGDVQRGEITLFVDEHLDAPPAIFAVRAAAPGRARLLFNLMQDGGQIASVVHHVTVYATGATVPVASTRVTVASHLVQATTGDPVSTVPTPAPVEAPTQPYPRPLPPAPAPPAPASRTYPAPQAPAVPPPVSAARGGASGWTAPAFAAGGWAGTGAFKALLGATAADGAPVSRLTDLLLGLVAGLIIAWSLRRSDPRFRAGQVALIAVGWTLAWAALPLFAGVIESTTTGRIAAGVASGALGGVITAAVLGSAGHRGMASIAGSWVFAFVLAQLMAPALGAGLPPILSSAVFWGLIAGIGTALTTRVMRDA